MKEAKRNTIRLTPFVLKYRLFILAGLLALLTWSLLGIRHLNVSVSIADYFVESDVSSKQQDQFEELFGKGDFFGVLFKSDDVFSNSSLEKIHEIGEKIKQEIPFVNNLYSIAHISSLEMGGKKFYFDNQGEVTADKDYKNRIVAAFYKDPSLLGVLFSKDRKEAWIMAPLTFSDTNTVPNEFDLGEQIYSCISSISCDSEMKIIPVGVSVYAHRKRVEMMDDLSLVLIVGFILAIILCLVFFKNGQSLLATLLLIALTPLIVFGGLAWFHIPAESAFIAVPILLTMGVSIGNGVHINHFFKMHFQKTGQVNESIVHAMDYLWKPILFTALTTIVALLSFLTVQIYPIRWVGLVSAVSIAVVFLLCMLLFPIILSFGKHRSRTENTKQSNASFELFFQALSVLLIRHPKRIMFVFIVSTVLAIYGSLNVSVDFDAEKMMGTKLPHMQDQVEIKNAQLCSNEFMNLTLLGEINCYKDTSYIRKLEALQKDIDSLPLVKRSTSLIEILSKANRQHHGRMNYFYFAPKKPKSLASVYKKVEKYGSDHLRKWLSEDYSSTRIFIEMSDFSSKTIVNNINEIDRLVAKHFPANTQHFLTGSTYQMSLMNQYITKGLIHSIGIALLMISLIMMFFFRSIKLGLIAMVPNVFPIIICGGIVGYFNIPLEFVTMTVAPLILGLAVDDTIHFITSLKNNIADYNSFILAIDASYKGVGIAISKTTIILCTTFMVFTVSDIRSTVNMGILSVVGILAAYLADIFIVPLLIKWTGTKNLKRPNGI